MRITRRSGLMLAVAQGALAVFGVRLAWADGSVGKLSKKENEVWGTMKGAAQVALEEASQIFRNQKLETGDHSAAVVRFIDDSQLSLGAHANAVIDDYVFNGDKSRSSVMLTKGAFRFISGQMPEKNMKLNTPTVGIGIRGTELLIDVYDDGSTELSTVEGAASVMSLATNEVLNVLAGQSILADAKGAFIGGVRDYIHKSADDAIQREIDKLRSKSPIPLPDIPNPFR
jgi:ferric-dicitrate binding protein FerR (iron transport regulator)